MEKEIIVFTDGACSGNPGPGGWASIIGINDEVHILKNYNISTTNNRMELLAVIETLKYLLENKLNTRKITITSDSSYVINAINKRWVDSWSNRKWKTAKGEAVKNKAMWEKYIEFRKEFDNITFKWVKGHDGNPMNEAADKEARAMAVLAVERKGDLQ